VSAPLCFTLGRPPRAPLFPYTTLFRSEWIRELRPETRERSRRRRCLHRYLEPRIDCGDAVRTTEWAAHRRCQRGWHRGRLQASVPFLGWGFFCCPGADTRERREHGRGSGDDDAEYGGRHHTDD